MARSKCSKGEETHKQLVRYLLDHPEELDLNGNFLIGSNVVYYEGGRVAGEIDLLAMQARDLGGLDRIVLTEVKCTSTPKNMGKADDQLLRADMFLSYKLGLIEPEYQHYLKFGGFKMIKRELKRR